MSVESNLKTSIHNRLERMSAARAVWEEGTLRAANDELYAILDDVFALYSELKSEVGKRRAFAALLTDLVQKSQANTSLSLKVVRYVFGKQGRREEVYARVLAIANDMKVPSKALPAMYGNVAGLKKSVAYPFRKNPAR